MNRSPISVLLIDDDAIINIVHQKFLEKSGFFAPIRFVNSSQKGIDQLKSGQTPPDLILLDIRMPQIDGFEFLKLFDRLPDSVKRVTRIVMLTSSLDFGDKDKALQSPHVVDYLDKPLDRAKIDRLIQRFTAD